METGQQGGRYPPFAGLIRPGPAGKRPHTPSLRTRDKSCALEYKNTSLDKMAGSFDSRLTSSAFLSVGT